MSPSLHKEVGMTCTSRTNLSDLITLFFNEFLELYGDEEMAAVATAAVINDLLSGDRGPKVPDDTQSIA